MVACIALRPSLRQEIPSVSPVLFWYILFGPEFGKTKGRFSVGSGMRRQEGLPYFSRRKLPQCWSPALLQVSTDQMWYRRPSANSLLLQQQTGKKAGTNIQYHWARFSLCCRGMEQEEISDHFLLSTQCDSSSSRAPAGQGWPREAHSQGAQAICWARHGGSSFCDRILIWAALVPVAASQGRPQKLRCLQSTAPQTVPLGASGCDSDQ